jgi:hypothetical protein
MLPQLQNSKRGFLCPDMRAIEVNNNNNNNNNNDRLEI